MSPKHCKSIHRRKGPRRPAAALLACAMGAGLLLTAAGCGPSSPSAVSDTPTPAVVSPTPTPEPVPTPTPTPVVTPTPTPEPVPAFDFSLPAPETAAVEMDYFSDALFIGDSRTDGLRLYSGIKGADFYCYKGLTVFDMQERKVVELDGQTLSVVQALERAQYAKVYLSLGINELGYFDDQGFEDTFRTFLRQLKQLQPDALIYLENVVPVNPDKCDAYNQPYYVTNKQVAVYNEIFSRLAPEEQVILLDVAAALSDEEGILAPENTVDGVHFTKDWYKTWLDYLMTHTVAPELYQAGQTNPAPAPEETAPAEAAPAESTPAETTPAETIPVEGETVNET